MTLKTILTVGALMLTTALAGCGQGDSSGKGSAPSSFKSVDITGAPYANTLALPDVDGKMRDLSEFKGKVVFVFFGYTQCPDVCPTTMAEIAEIKKKLGPDGAKVQGVFVTVDPERDTAEVVKAYVASFGPDMIGLRAADDAQLKAAALHFKVYFTKEKGPTPTSYLVNHTAASFVFDPQGRVRLFTRYGTKIEDLLNDVKQLLR
jgi:protein SCO1